MNLMRAAVFEDIKRIVYRKDYPKPAIGPDDVLVKVYYCGICGSDVTNFTQGLYKIPLIMGHELVGEIEELGEKVAGFEVGDKVLGINVQLEVFNQNFQGLGIFMDGGFAEYVRVPKEFLFHAPKNTPLEECVLVESYAIGIRAMKLSKIGANQHVIIIGGGNMGLTTLSVLLRKKKPKIVTVIEPQEFLRKKAKELGASEALPPNKNLIRKYIEKVGPPNYIFECVGSEKTFKLALDLIKRGGTITIEGIFRGQVSFPLLLLSSKEICLQGLLGHNRNDIHRAIELVEQKEVQPRQLISEVLPLNEIQKAFEQFLNPDKREFIKIIIEIQD